MPTYDYECDSCQMIFEVRQSIHDEPLHRCTYCMKDNVLHRIPTVPMHVSVRLARSEIKTLGHLADRNSQKMSDDEKDERMAAQETRKVDPDGKEQPVRDPKAIKEAKAQQKLFKKINRMTPEQKTRYIENG